jgi:hypothetical protein
LTKYNLNDKLEAIYNLNEKGINTEHRPSNVVGPHGVTTQAIISPRGSSITFTGCGNVPGQQLPPYYVFSGKRMRNELLTGGLPGTDGTVTETGWSNSEVFGTYLNEHLQKFFRASPD